jgi:hypothetical protein
LAEQYSTVCAFSFPLVHLVKSGRRIATQRLAGWNEEKHDAASRQLLQIESAQSRIFQRKQKAK